MLQWLTKPWRPLIPLLINILHVRIYERSQLRPSRLWMGFRVMNERVMQELIRGLELASQLKAILSGSEVGGRREQGEVLIRDISGSFTRSTNASSCRERRGDPSQEMAQLCRSCSSNLQEDRGGRT
ncbi:hypothetical protein GW17_00018493 [Ensete ventricosum]|nr:hypothetical protein GW17_00018493 [Ensete ventricosum]